MTIFARGTEANREQLPPRSPHAAMTYRENPPLEDRGIAVTSSPPPGATPERAQQYAAEVDAAYDR